MINVIRFTAPWCAPCRMLAPIMSELEKEYSEKGVSFQTIDIDSDPDSASGYQIRSVPTVVVLNEQAAVKTLVGAHPKKVYQELLDETLRS